MLARADYGGPVTAIVGERHRRHAVSPGKEPAFRARADREFPEVAAVILFPAIDLKDGQCVRLEQGDMARATVFNHDPAAQARAFAARLRMAACRRSRRRLCRQAGECARPSRRCSRRSPCRFSSAAASATCGDRSLARQGHRARHPRHRRGARPGTGEELPRNNSPAASRSASMRATARSRSKAGPRPRR